MHAITMPPGASLREAAAALGYRIEGRALVPAAAGGVVLGPFPDAAAAWDALRERHPAEVDAIPPLPPAGSVPRPEAIVPFVRGLARGRGRR